MSRRRVKVKNPIIIKVLIIMAILLFVLVLIIFSYKMIKRNYNPNVYNLGEKSNVVYENDKLLINYNEYAELLDKYNLEKHLTSDDFSNNYYIASFQEYDSCAESKYKDVGNIKIDDENITIEFLIHNKCGMCKKNIILYIIKIDKIKEEKNILYEYNYLNNKMCGTISKS